MNHPIVISSRRIIYNSHGFSNPFFWDQPLKPRKLWMSEEDYKDILKWSNGTSDCD